MLPWLQTILNFPLSGNVNQQIEPDWFFGIIDAEVGDGEIEKEVFCKVASYGDQIGTLTKSLLALADELNVDSENIKPLSELKKIQTKVDTIKKSKKNRVRENAKMILDKLKDTDPDGFKSIIKAYGDD